MGVVLLAIAVGFAVGHFNLLPKDSKITQKVTLVGLVFLLVVMGAQLGSNEEVLNNFARMGWQAFLLAGGSIAASVLLVRLAEKFIVKKQPKHLLTNQSEEVGDDR